MGSLLKTTMKATLALLLVLCGIGLSEAGFRCTFGDWACKAGCKVLGQSSGTCDDQNKCWCSERAISFAEFREMLPSRCTLGLPFCKATCHAIGRRDGPCEYGNGCECTDSRLTPTEFALCAAESTCRTHCQAQGKATGRCNGWQCECLSNPNANTSIDFPDL